MKHSLSLFTLLFWTIIPVLPQNLELVGKEKPVKINGGISLNQIGYLSTDSISQREPYNYFLSGNLNLSPYGWSIPLTFSYSNQKTSYTQPFNQYSMHPYYKWIRLHVGYTSMSFSPYTLNGHLFLGAGIELTPEGPFTFSAMYGRMKKATPYDSTLAKPPPPDFERWGYGVKGGYKFDAIDLIKATIDVSAFHAIDKAGSLNWLPDSMQSPGENFVLGTNLNVTIAGHFNFNTELASSMITKNTGSELGVSGATGWNKMMENTYTGNATTEHYSASRYNFGYSVEQYSIGLGYERIDPGYQTYGAYYFSNDLENVTLNGTLNLLDKKVNLAANVGRQRDNLDDSKTSDMKRWVTAFNLGYNPGEKLSASISYSTFTSFMNIRSQFVDINQSTPYDNLDTLNFTQLSTSTSATIGYILKNTESVRQNVNVNFSHQASSEKQNGTDTTGGSKFYLFSGSYSYSMVPSSFTISASFNANINDSPGMETTTIGPSLAFNKLFFDKKLRNSLACSYNMAYTNNAKQNRVLSLRYNASYTLGKSHNFNLGLTFMDRKTNMQQSASKLSEFLAMLGYSFNF
jgi:hypothetical protein